MNEEQKKRIAHEICNWQNAKNDHTASVTGDRMAALLQELIDAPEPEPVAHAVILPNGMTRIWFSDKERGEQWRKEEGIKQELTPLYTAPPTPSVPDELIPNLVQTAMRGLLTDDDMANLRRFDECCQDIDADVHDVAEPEMKRLELAGVVRSCGFGRHETTAFGDWLLAAAPEAPAVQHSDDIAVDRFATAMKAKMAESRNKGRYGWDDENVCESEYLRMFLQQAVNKGDPVDVGNFAMMLFCRGESAAPLSLAAQSEQHLEMVNAPTPSVPDEQLQAAFDRGLKAGNEQAIAQQIEIHKLHDLLAVQQPEQSADPETQGQCLGAEYLADAIRAMNEKGQS